MQAIILEESNSIVHAVETLLRVCDGAATQDQRGFNKWDSGLARSLASGQWSPRQLRIAWFMLRKYRKQLSNYGIDYDLIPEPPRASRRQEKRDIRLSDGKFIVEFSYDPRIVNEVKTLPSQFRLYNSAHRWWELKPTIDTIEGIHRLIGQYDFDATEEAINKTEEIIGKFTEGVVSSMAEEAELEIPTLLRTPRPYQKAGVRYMISKKKVINGADMGLGKTGQTLMAFEATGSYPALVICPASVKYNWQKEVGLWLSDRTTEVLNGKPGKYDADITIINYDVLKKHIEPLKNRGFKAIAADEFHKLKSQKSQRSQFVKEIIGQTEYRFLLSGTPIPNRYKELIFPLQLIDHIEDFGGSWRFLTHHCGAYRDRFGLKADASTNGEELNAKLRANCMWRVLKKDVLKELPPKQHTELFFPLSNEKEYREAEQDLGSFLAEKALRDEEFLASIADLPEDEQEKAKHDKATSSEEKTARAEQLVKFTTLRKLAALGVMDSVKEWIGDHFEETNQKLVIGVWHQEIADKLLEILPKDTPKITGEVSALKRQEYVDKFQNDPSCRFIICNIQAGGVGITLTAASNMIAVEPPWNPGDLEQLEDRIFRIGQTADSVNIYHVKSQNTVYDDMYGIIQEKSQVIGEATSQNVPFLERFRQRIQKKGGK